MSAIDGISRIKAVTAAIGAGDWPAPQRAPAADLPDRRITENAQGTRRKVHLPGSGSSLMRWRIAARQQNGNRGHVLLLVIDLDLFVVSAMIFTVWVSGAR